MGLLLCKLRPSWVNLARSLEHVEYHNAGVTLHEYLVGLLSCKLQPSWVNLARSIEPVEYHHSGGTLHKYLMWLLPCKLQQSWVNLARSIEHVEYHNAGVTLHEYLVGLLLYMVTWKQVDNVHNVDLTLQYIVIHTSCTFADALYWNQELVF